MPPDPQERNLRLYGGFFPLSRASFYGPVFFLYFSEHFSLDRVLALQSIYYLSVFVIEIPSGYLSDRVGRVLTLRLSALSYSLSFLLYVVAGDHFLLFAAAQIAFALGFAIQSGTDASFHYDTLVGLGRTSEFAGREARVHRDAYIVGAATAVVGGLGGAIDLRFAYGLGLVAAGVMVVISWRMTEPPRSAGGYTSHGLIGQLGACLVHLRTPALAWIFGYAVLMVILEHLPYEFSQPYVAFLLGEEATDVRRTPIATGLLNAVFRLVAAVAAARAAFLLLRFGPARTLLGATSLQTLLIAAMALTIHPAVLGLLLFRSAYAAISQVVINTTVTPRVPQEHRATYLSLHSLAGRLGYGVVLAMLGAASQGESPNPETIQQLLGWGSGLALAGLVILGVTRRMAPKSDPTP